MIPYRILIPCPPYTRSPELPFTYLTFVFHHCIIVSYHTTPPFYPASVAIVIYYPPMNGILSANRTACGSYKGVTVVELV